MKLLGVMALASTLIGEATALYIEKTCANLSLNPSTDVLSANCNNKKGVANPNSLDLNTCLGWNDEDSAITYGTNFGNVCKDCYLETRFLDTWEGYYSFVVCTCAGIAGKDYGLGTSVHIDNVDGVLICSP
ncbi:hypothetical protein F4821DRAFT_245726 [Hypoxylon rubiginosum]|uniref:Uncharacterized protein n=1 Tax=Hypoxylon rubiginosum TaxID=110542 RepID=A0ACC0CRE8_9PEZI|nr:hypothetical protein F4821DRAFT_245726 [Hypoxylon rubiginosum]